MAPPEGLVLAIDQGTSATKALLLDVAGDVVGRGYAPVDIAYPGPGRVEQDPDQIWSSVEAAVERCLRAADRRQVSAVGLSTQRESVVMWERRTGRPCGPLLGWQDRRGSALCRRLAGDAEVVREVSGLPLDPMFSASKAAWLLDRYDADRGLSGRGELCLGTVDSWLLRRLTGQHQVEIGNASRTQLLDVRSGAWSQELLGIFGVPSEVLPTVVPSAGRHFGVITGLASLAGVPVTAVLGDSHAALFAQGGSTPGVVKATYGTGSSVMSVVPTADQVPHGLCLTIAWQLDRIVHAVEGNIASAGSTLTWLAGLLGVATGDLVAMAETAPSNGVSMVPAFEGLGSPWWDDRAVALVSGLTLGTERSQVARAALESVAMQVADVVDAMLSATTAGQRVLLADGGISASDALMQVQADVLGHRVERAQDPELSALGAAHLAQVGAGLWSLEQLSARGGLPRDVFEPGADSGDVQGIRHRWHDELNRSRWTPGGRGDP